MGPVRSKAFPLSHSVRQADRHELLIRVQGRRPDQSDAAGRPAWRTLRSPGNATGACVSSTGDRLLMIRHG
jgi:hypothetical protein